MPYQITHEERSIKLTNLIALLGAGATAFILCVLIYFWGWPAESNRWYMVGTITIYLLIPIFNRAGFHLFSKYLLCITPVLFCFVISIVNKKIGPIFINDYYVYRLVLLTASIVPILIFRYNQYGHLVLCALPVILGLLFFDTVHTLFDVGIFQTGYEDATYFMTTFTSIACYIALVGFIYALKRKNDIYLQDIFDQKELLREKSETLVHLNHETELQNIIISQQNDQLKDFSTHLKKKVETRTKELSTLNRELARQNAKLEQFTFITAHNLKSPVSQIKGLLNLLNYETLNDSTIEILDKIKNSSVDLEEVIFDLNKILNIKNHSYSIEELNLAEIINHVFFNLKPDIEKNDISIHRSFASEIEIHSIKPFVYSIFYNLVQNAVKYYDSDKADSFISVSVTEVDSGLTVVVEDNGIGFEQYAVKDKIFQLYQKFNTQVSGKGMGLFLVKTQLEMIKGSIKVKSEVSEGTRFEIKIPRVLTFDHETISY